MWGRGGDGLLRLQGRIAGLFGFADELGGLGKHPRAAAGPEMGGFGRHRAPGGALGLETGDLGLGKRETGLGGLPGRASGLGGLGKALRGTHWGLGGGAAGLWGLGKVGPRATEAGSNGQLAILLLSQSSNLQPAQFCILQLLHHHSLLQIQLQKLHLIHCQYLQIGHLQNLKLIHCQSPIGDLNLQDSVIRRHQDLLRHGLHDPAGHAMSPGLGFRWLPSKPWMPRSLGVLWPSFNFRKLLKLATTAK